MKASKTNEGWELTFSWWEVLYVVLVAVTELLKDGDQKKALPPGGLKIQVRGGEGTIENKPGVDTKMNYPDAE